MNYKVVVVTTKDSCCSETFMNDEVERTCNAMASQGYVLVNLWESNVKTCGASKHAICLVFARP